MFFISNITKDVYRLLVPVFLIVIITDLQSIRKKNSCRTFTRNDYYTQLIVPHRN